MKPSEEYKSQLDTQELIREKGITNRQCRLSVFFIIPLKKGIMLLTQPLGLSVCLCVCVSVCHHDCDKMAGLSSTVLHEGITYDNGSAL